MPRAPFPLLLIPTPSPSLPLAPLSFIHCSSSPPLAHISSPPPSLLPTPSPPLSPSLLLLHSLLLILVFSLNSWTDASKRLSGQTINLLSIQTSVIRTDSHSVEELSKIV